MNIKQYILLVSVAGTASVLLLGNNNRTLQLAVIAALVSLNTLTVSADSEFLNKKLF